MWNGKGLCVVWIALVLFILSGCATFDADRVDWNGVNQGAMLMLLSQPTYQPMPIAPMPRSFNCVTRGNFTSCN